MRVLLAAFAVFVLVAAQGYAATGTVQGNVIDRETKQPLQGATIVLEALDGTGSNRTYGAFANKDGSYVIDNVPSGDWRAKVTFVGYKHVTRRITVTDDETTEANFEVAFDVKHVEEVVVTGLSSRHLKEEAEVAVSRVDAEQLQEANVYTDVTQLMQGKAAGVNVMQGSGNVGGGMRFTVRGGGGLNGTGNPLIFVDGARIVAGEINPAATAVGGQGFSALTNINPQDIEKVEVLKGPAGAALYGTAGSNGVILITTKRGSKSLDNLTVSASAIMGWNQNAVDYDSNRIASAQSVNDGFKTGPIQEYNVSVNGNSGGLGYFLSYGHRDEEGVILQNSLTRESVRGNFEFSPVSDLSVSLGGSYAVSDVARPQGDNNIFSDYSVKYLVNPNWLGTQYIFGVDSVAMASIENTLVTERFTTSAALNYTPQWAPGLSLNGLVGLDVNGNKNENYFPPGLFYTGIGFDGNRTTLSQNVNRLNFDVNAAYATTFGSSVASTTRLGVQAFDTKTSTSTQDMQEFASSKIRALQSAGTFLTSSDGVAQSREAGIYLQEEIVIDETYFVSAGARLDQTTLLNAESTPQVLPRVSGMVRLDKFDFLPESFNLFKVRAAFGQSGQPPAITGADPLRWSTARSGYGVGYVVGSIGNPDVLLERVNELEVGFELEIDARYGIDFTYYTGSGTNSIVNFANTPSTGMTITGVPRNVGGISNWGFEAALYASVIRTVEYGLDLNLIVNNQNNEVTDLGGSQPLGSTYGDQFIKVGYPRSSWHNFKVVGAAYDENGVYSNAIYSDSIEYIANSIPEWTGSFSANFRFLEHFSLYAMAEWATGYSKLDLSREFQIVFQNDVEYTMLQGQLFNPVEDGGLTPGSAEYMAAAEKFAKLDGGNSTNYIVSSDWFRIRELSFRIDATTWLRDAFGGSGLKGLNFVASVRNLALFTAYTGADPESNADGGQASGVDRSVEFNTLPQPQVFNFQLNFSF